MIDEEPPAQAANGRPGWSEERQDTQVLGHNDFITDATVLSPDCSSWPVANERSLPGNQFHWPANTAAPGGGR